MKKGDFVLIAVILLLSAGTIFLLLRQPGAVAVVRAPGITYRMPLNRDDQKTIKTELGENTVAVRDGKAYVLEADCPDKLCALHPGISRVGESIVCLPHQLIVKIDGEGEREVDIIAGQ